MRLLAVYFALLILFPLNLLAQVTSYPYQQSFEETFTTGESVEFLPNWFGNEVQTGNRIYQSSNQAHNGNFSLAAQPTSTFSPEISLHLNTSSLAGAQVSFWLASESTGGTRGGQVSLQLSADGGSTFSYSQVIANLPNSNTSFSRYAITIPAEYLRIENAVVCWKIERTDGSGTAATILLDDVLIEPAEPPPPVPVLPYRSVVINEIFADPNPKGSLVPIPQVLPTESGAEWIELHNTSDNNINLSGWQLNQRALPNVEIAANNYLIVVPEAYATAYQAYGSVAAMPSWNSLTNSGESINLTDENNRIIDSLSYTLAWYQNEDKADGGWSLEQIDPEYNCSVAANWRASVADIGASPGSQNSVYDTLSDTITARLQEAVWLNDSSIRLRFNKAVMPESAQFSLEPKLESSGYATRAETVILYFSKALSSGVNYQLTYKVEFCSGEILESISSVIEPMEAQNGSIVLNEIMYDPGPDGVEWIELFNTTDSYLDVSRWNLALLENGLRANFRLANELLLIPPNEYLVITTKPELILQQFSGARPQQIHENSQMFSLRNSGDTVALVNPAGKITDRVGYSDDLHHSLVRISQAVSLERINPYAYSEQSNWVSSAGHSSITSAYGTPTYSNSQFSTQPNVGSSLSISPEVLHPIPDGVNDFIIIRYTLDEPSSIGKVFILNAQGRVINTLREQSMLGAEGSLQWDGLSNSGQVVPTGYYIVVMEAIGSSGKSNISRKVFSVTH